MSDHAHFGHEEVDVSGSPKGQIFKKLTFWVSVGVIAGTVTACIEHALNSKTNPSPIGQTIRYGGLWTGSVEAESKTEVVFLFTPQYLTVPSIDGQLMIGNRGYFLRANDPIRFDCGTLHCVTTGDRIGEFEISGSAKDKQTARRLNRLQVLLAIDGASETILMHRPDFDP